MATPDLTNQVATDINNMKLLLTPRGTSVTTASTSGTGEDNLSSFTLTGGDLAATGVLEVWASGDMTGHNDSKAVRFYIGSTNWPVFETATPGKWQTRVTIMLVSAASERITIESQTSCYGLGSDYTTNYGFYDTATEDTSGDLTVKFTGECLNASDTINQYVMLAQQLKVG